MSRAAATFRTCLGQSKSQAQPLQGTRIELTRAGRETGLAGWLGKPGLPTASAGHQQRNVLKAIEYID